MHERFGKKVEEERIWLKKKRTKDKYDWDNDELEELEGLVEDEVSHPNIPE